MGWFTSAAAHHDIWMKIFQQGTFNEGFLKGPIRVIVGLQQCFELFEMLGLKLQGIVTIEAINEFLFAMDFSEVVEALCFEDRHGGVGTGRHLKI